MSALNKRCPCGSGKKFKNCCAKKDSPKSDQNKQPTHREVIAEKLNNANALYAAGQMDSAYRLYNAVIKLAPRNKDALFKLSLITLQGQDYKKAEPILQKLVKLEPKNTSYLCNLGLALHEVRRPGEAISVLNKGISLDPNQADLYLNRANSLAVLAENDRAIADYRKAVKIEPQNNSARMNLVYTMNFSPNINETDLFEAHKKHARHITTGRIAQHDNDPTPDRRLRIGYLSSEFRAHSVAYFIEHVLQHHNKAKVEIYAYYNHEVSDVVTKHMMELCDHWCNIATLSDQAVLQKIHQDKIDILVDLMGYTARTKLEVLAQKPAPIQCEWLGYPNTTGLDAMDYWICDEITNPPGLTDAYYSETLLRLPNCFICFQPPAYAPEPETPPCLRNGYVTFGSFNNYAKVPENLLELWAEILNAVPGSHLLLKSACLGNPAQQQQLRAFFKSRNIVAQRIELEGHDPSRGGHLEKYFNMDIALDTFPYNGTTTTCEALWMGVPTITLSGDSHRSRVGNTLLKNAGLGELVADSRDNYVELAVALANNPARISQYCKALRATLTDSNITDSIQFTRSLEAAYSSIWKKWCDDQA